MRFAVALAFAGLIAVAACAREMPPPATAFDAQRANIELVDLQQGRQLLLGKCSGCHRTPLPREHSAAEWPHMLDEMGARAKLDGAQRGLLEKYLVTMASREAR